MNTHDKIELPPLPEWSEAESNVKNGVATPLDIFIHRNEPAGDDEYEWRDELEAAIHAAIEAGRKRRGEPVNPDWCEGCTPDNCSTGCGRNVIEGRKMAAEPVKVPSEREIGDVLKSVERESRYGHHHWGLWKEFAYALLARYGHPAQTAAQVDISDNERTEARKRAGNAYRKALASLREDY
jgi:hypothetical protein